MNAVIETKIGNGESLSPLPRLQHRYENCTHRILELETIVAGLRAALEDAEAALEKERARQPEIGDFVRCPLTNFFGRVTKVTPRPHGRPWVEIIPYLTKDMPGHATMDLYDSWELIDPPTDIPAAKVQPPKAKEPVTDSPRLPSVASFQWPKEPEPDQQLADEIEFLMSDLLAEPAEAKRSS